MTATSIIRLSRTYSRPDVLRLLQLPSARLALQPRAGSASGYGAAAILAAPRSGQPKCRGSVIRGFSCHPVGPHTFPCACFVSRPARRSLYSKPALRICFYPDMFVCRLKKKEKERAPTSTFAVAQRAVAERAHTDDSD